MHEISLALHQNFRLALFALHCRYELLFWTEPLVITIPMCELWYLSENWPKHDPNVAHFQPIKTLIKLQQTFTNFLNVVIG